MKKVIVVASGETERRSLPHLTVSLAEEGIQVTEVRIPPRHRDLTISVAVQLIDAAWFEYQYNDPPDKFVILLDVDGKDPIEVLRPWRRDLQRRLNPKVGALVQFAYAQWHLEAWFFADPGNLRRCLGRGLGSVDSSKPDEIPNPKEHLKHLLGETTYTSTKSEEIAAQLDANTVVSRSGSFGGFLGAIRNGGSVDTTHQAVVQRHTRRR